jgi:hypothetical protein
MYLSFARFVCGHHPNLPQLTRLCDVTGLRFFAEFFLSVGRKTKIAKITRLAACNGAGLIYETIA